MLVIKFVFGGKEAVLDYLIDKANTYIAAMGANQIENAQAIYEGACKVIDTLTSLKNWCPKKWQGDYERVLTALNSAFAALEDCKITAEECNAIVGAWYKVYANWRAE